MARAEQATLGKEANASGFLFAALDPDPVIPTSSAKVFGTLHAFPMWEFLDPESTLRLMPRDLLHCRVRL